MLSASTDAPLRALPLRDNIQRMPIAATPARSPAFQLCFPLILSSALFIVHPTVRGISAPFGPGMMLLEKRSFG